MTFDLRRGSIAFNAACLSAITCSLTALTVVVFFPGPAAAVVAQATTALQCARSTSCVVVTNTKAGSAVAANSVTGIGLTGSSLNSYGITGSTSALGNKAGIAGYDYSAPENATNAGVFGSSPRGFGVEGNSSEGSGVEASSQTGPGIISSSISGVGLAASSATSFGITGTTSASAAANNAGVIGYDNGVTNTNSGVEGSSLNGKGVSGFSQSGFGLYSQSSNIGVLTFSENTGLYANGNTTGVIAVTAGGALNHVLVGVNAATDQDVVTIDNAGNEILAGTITESGQPLIRTTTSGGKTVATYSTRTSSPTLEDFGNAQLTNGRAYVALDSTFASTIDSRKDYMVFLSPHGDNRGLFVTSISAHGFAVHESNAGHSTFAFDYRIVAKPYDTNAARLASTTALSGLIHGRKLLSTRRGLGLGHHQ